MSETFRADSDVTDRVSAIDASIAHWSSQVVRLEFQKLGALETIQTLEAARKQTVKQAVVAAGFQADRVESASLDMSTHEVTVTLKGGPPSEG